MAKGFGIAALVVAILAIFTPVVGILLSALALVLASIGALAGDRAFAVATPLIAGVNTFFLSPSTWIHIENARHDSGISALMIGFYVLLAAPVIAIALNASGKVMLDRKTAA